MNSVEYYQLKKIWKDRIRRMKSILKHLNPINFLEIKFNRTCIRKLVSLVNQMLLTRVFAFLCHNSLLSLASYCNTYGLYIVFAVYHFEIRCKLPSSNVRPTSPDAFCNIFNV